MSSKLSLAKDILSGNYKEMLKKKIILFLLIKVVLPAFGILIIISIPLMIIEELNNSFTSWFKGKEGNYSSKNAAVLKWLDTQGNNFDIGGGYVTKEGIKGYIKGEENTYLHDKELDIVESTETTVTDTKDKSTNKSSTKRNIKYKLMIAQETAPYKLPWQLMVIKNAVVMEPYSNEYRDNLLNAFKAKYYGLLQGNDSIPVTQSSISNKAKFRHNKRVEITTTSTKEYYVEEEIVEKKIVEEEYYDVEKQKVLKRKVIKEEKKKVRKGPYYQTTTTKNTIEYPLPYFTKIESMTGEVVYQYENKKTDTTKTVVSADKTIKTTVHTIINEPVKKKSTSSLNAYKYISTIKGIGIHPQDLDYIKEQVKLLPDGTTAAALLDPVLPYANDKFDMYYGTEYGQGKFKLSGKGIFQWPINGAVNVVSGFGMRLHPVYKVYKLHTGIDIDCSTGTQVVAADEGEVITSEFVSGYGYLIIIQHKDNLKTYYAHLHEFKAMKGDYVKKGEVIALSGGAVGDPGAGTSTGPHLHFETRVNDVPMDPAQYLGLVPDVPDVLPDELKYKEIDMNKLRDYLATRKSMFIESNYAEQINSAAKLANINPLLMFSITGQEMNFVKNDSAYWINVYGKDRLLKNLQNINVNARVEEAPMYIVNNPFNVYHSWWEYNTNLEDASKIAAKTIINLSKGRPEGVHPILWINTRGGKGGYAEDESWWLGVSRIYDMLKGKIGYK